MAGGPSGSARESKSSRFAKNATSSDASSGWLSMNACRSGARPESSASRYSASTALKWSSDMFRVSARLVKQFAQRLEPAMQQPRNRRRRSIDLPRNLSQRFALQVPQLQDHPLI